MQSSRKHGGRGGGDVLGENFSFGLSHFDEQDFGGKELSCPLLNSPLGLPDNKQIPQFKETRLRKPVMSVRFREECF